MGRGEELSLAELEEMLAEQRRKVARLGRGLALVRAGSGGSTSTGPGDRAGEVGDDRLGGTARRGGPAGECKFSSEEEDQEDEEEENIEKT